MYFYYLLVKLIYGCGPFYFQQGCVQLSFPQTVVNEKSNENIKIKQFWKRNVVFHLAKKVLQKISKSGTKFTFINVESKYFSQKPSNKVIQDLKCCFGCYLLFLCLQMSQTESYKYQRF